jgi:hypothetical protein
MVFRINVRNFRCFPLQRQVLHSNSATKDIFCAPLCYHLRAAKAHTTGNAAFPIKLYREEVPAGGDTRCRLGISARATASPQSYSPVLRRSKFLICAFSVIGNQELAIRNQPASAVEICWEMRVEGDGETANLLW